MEEILIRELKSTDQEAIEFTKHRLSTEWNYPAERINQLYIAPSFLEGFPYVFVARAASGEFVGEAIAAIEDEGYLDINHQPWLFGLFVREEFRGRGIGERLIRSVEQVCLTHHFTYLYLDTVDATGYYERLGRWETLGTAIWDERGEETTVMRKKLS